MSLRHPRLPFVWLRPPERISTTHYWPASPLWPGRCTEAQANGPLSCLTAVERDGPARASTTCCAPRAFCPASGTWCTRNVTLASTHCGNWRHRCSSEERRRLFLEVIDMAAANDMPPPTAIWRWPPSVGEPDMPPDAGRTIFTVARVAGWTAHYRRSCPNARCASALAPVYSVASETGV